jgi:hypothetical protein
MSHDVRADKPGLFPAKLALQDCIQLGLLSSICLGVLLVRALKGMENVECWEGVGRGKPKMPTILPAIRQHP